MTTTPTVPKLSANDVLTMLDHYEGGMSPTTEQAEAILRLVDGVGNGIRLDDLVATLAHPNALRRLAVDGLLLAIKPQSDPDTAYVIAHPAVRDALKMLDTADVGWDDPTGYCTDHGSYDPTGNCAGCMEG